MLLVIDNQNAFIKKWEREFLAKQEFDYLVLDHNQPIKLPANKVPSGVVLSGGRGNPYKPLNLTANFVAMMNFDVPTLGFCLGHEIIACAYRGHIDKLPDYYTRQETIAITVPNDPIFKGLAKTEIALKRRHSYHVSELPPNFLCLAESAITPHEIIRHKDKPIYGFQGHPEVSGSDGRCIVRNFLAMCGLPLQA